jgi:hypothetical protein
MSIDFEQPMKNQLRDRAELQVALAEACELEHGLACSYLFAAFSLKRHISEGLTWEEQQLVRKWASNIYFIASQEMLHLAQAWNLMIAVGGSPYVARPNFPQPSRYYPLHIPLEITGFDESTLARFIAFERPEGTAYDAATLAFAPEHLRARIDALPPIHSIGRLYEIIEDTLIGDPSLIVAGAADQVDVELVDFPDLVAVSDVRSAIAAVTTIRDQGEGLEADRVDCHYGLFRRMLRETLDASSAARAQGREFVPGRYVLSNPCYYDDDAYAARGATKVRDPQTYAVGQLFDDLYAAMLVGLQFVFAQPAASRPVRRRIAKLCIDVMPAVLVPLGEALTMLPSGIAGRNAGAGFFIGRFVALPADERIALPMLLARFAALRDHAVRLADGSPAEPALRHVAAILNERTAP